MLWADKGFSKCRVRCEYVCWEGLVRGTGLEPARPCGHWLLRPARLPVPPAPLGISQWYHLDPASRRRHVATQSARHGPILFLETSAATDDGSHGAWFECLPWWPIAKNIRYPWRRTESAIADKTLQQLTSATVQKTSWLALGMKRPVLRLQVPDRADPRG